MAKRKEIKINQVQLNKVAGVTLTTKHATDASKKTLFFSKKTVKF